MGACSSSRRAAGGAEGCRDHSCCAVPVLRALCGDWGSAPPTQRFCCRLSRAFILRGCSAVVGAGPRGARALLQPISPRAHPARPGSAAQAELKHSHSHGKECFEGAGSTTFTLTRDRFSAIHDAHNALAVLMC